MNTVLTVSRSGTSYLQICHIFPALIWEIFRTVVLNSTHPCNEVVAGNDALLSQSHFSLPAYS